MRWIQWTWSFLAKRGQICRHCGRLLDAQAHGRHLASGLGQLRVVNPGNQVSQRVLGCAGRDGVTAHEVRQIRTESPIGCGTSHGMAIDTGGPLEDLLSFRYRAAHSRGLALLLNPAVEILPRVDVNAQKHQGMLRSTILRTLPEEQPGLM